MFMLKWQSLVVAVNDSDKGEHCLPPILANNGFF